MTDACHGAPCYLKISDLCIPGTEITFPAHRNVGKKDELEKCHIFTVPACFACHYELDPDGR
jgi:hypothetical protein